jgi:large subunit ribosomal protein L17
MPKPNKGPRLGGGPSHERLMLNQLAAQLFENKSIQTTQTKAKRLQPVAEQLITKAKRGDLASRRRVMRQIHDKSVVHELFTEIAPLVENRDGGYTRVIKTGFRKGDNAPLAVIELVLEPVESQASADSTQKKVTPQHAAEEPEAEEVEAADAEAEEADASDEGGSNEAAADADADANAEDAEAGDETE